VRSQQRIQIAKRYVPSQGEEQRIKNRHGNFVFDSLQRGGAELTMLLGTISSEPAATRIKSPRVKTSRTTIRLPTDVSQASPDSSITEYGCKYVYESSSRCTSHQHEPDWLDMITSPTVMSAGTNDLLIPLRPGPQP
jgi:hypothetical protein